jgi:hypothetical protein
MAPYRRLDCDVVMTEELELERLVNVAMSCAPSTPALPPDMMLPRDAGVPQVTVAAEVHGVTQSDAMVSFAVQPVRAVPASGVGAEVVRVMAMPIQIAVPSGVAVRESAAGSGGVGGNGGPLRARKTKRMERRLTHWQCTFCRHEMPLAEDAVLCGRCKGPRRQLGDADTAAREAARRQARQTEMHGRQLNGRGVGCETVARAAQGVFATARYDALVVWEVGELERFTGAPTYLKREDCVIGVVESFLICYVLK